LKEKFISKIRLQFKTLKKAFTELDRKKQGFITLEAFEELLESWGFEAKKEHI
jgi:Ca2+-binding EF-hand superfamily protein